MDIKILPHQHAALVKMMNGCILCGGVGSGKSITAIAYYCLVNGARIENGEVGPLENKNGRLYIITTAKKRDTHEWEEDLAHFDLGDTDIRIDSWNNVKKYTNVSEAFFIFDEQRVVGYGSWSRAFRRIADSNKWIMLSATPGDDWGDYMSVFIANGYYKNKTDFMNQHAIVTRYGDFPQIRWWNTRKLEMLRDKILVPMPMDRSTTPHELTITNGYDNIKYYLLLTGELRRGFRVRFNPWTHDIIDNASELCQCLRRTVNEDTSRKAMLLGLALKHKRLIVFYNYDYELDILRELPYEPGTVVAEYNGHKHEEVPDSERWIYLVNYGAGSEGWNCITTNAMVFYSLNYSYRIMTQAAGRIDRMNTPFKDLYYYRFSSAAPIDQAIEETLKRKKKFNEKRFLGEANKCMIRQLEQSGEIRSELMLPEKVQEDLINASENGGAR